MTKLPRVSGKDVLEALQSGGYHVIHIRGSHHYLRNPSIAGLVVVPVHGNRDPPTGTVHSILRQAGLTIDEFVDLLRH